MRTLIVALTAAATLGLSSAYAGRLVTPAINRSGVLDQRLLCTIVNGATKAVGPFDLTIFDSNGNAAVTFPVVGLQPGRTVIGVATDAHLGNLAAGYCVADGSGISKKTPITLCVVSSTNADCQAAVSAP